MKKLVFILFGLINIALLGDQAAILEKMDTGIENVNQSLSDNTKKLTNADIDTLSTAVTNLKDIDWPQMDASVFEGDPFINDKVKRFPPKLEVKLSPAATAVFKSILQGVFSVEKAQRAELLRKPSMNTPFVWSTDALHFLDRVLYVLSKQTS